MSSGTPVNVYGVPAQLTVATPSQPTAATTAATAIADINTALVSLANGTELSFATVNGQLSFEGGQQGFSITGNLEVGAPDEADAQARAEAAEAAITTAIAGINPAVTVTLERSSAAGEFGGSGQYTFSLLQ